MRIPSPRYFITDDTDLTSTTSPVTWHVGPRAKVVAVAVPGLSKRCGVVCGHWPTHNVKEGGQLTKYMISFGAHAMDQLPEEDMPGVAAAAHAAVQEILDAGAYVLSGGLTWRHSSNVAEDGTITDGPEPDAVGGLTVVDVASRDEALEWAAKIAAACRCTQEVWEIMDDAELDEMVRQATHRQ